MSAPDDDLGALVRTAEELVRAGDPYGAAAAYDRAYGLAPHEPAIVSARQALLDELAVEEHGLRFRYIPAGTRLLGSNDGDPDERPVHAVTLPGFWLTDVPLSWAAYCRILGWSDPPEGLPDLATEEERRDAFFLYEANKIRLWYCEDGAGRDWHADVTELSAAVPRPRPERYETKPMVSVGWQEAMEVAAALEAAAALVTPGVQYRLPTEAEWETAARGGLVGARYAWGDDPPTVDICDFGRFEGFSIRPSRSLPPNGYGLYGMCGGVWEWTADWYDAQYYAHCPAESPIGPESGTQKVIRGGSWADCAEAVTVSFRASRASSSWRDDEWGGQLTANIGFRLCRVTTN